MCKCEIQTYDNDPYKLQSQKYIQYFKNNNHNLLW